VIIAGLDGARVHPYLAYKSVMLFTRVTSAGSGFGAGASREQADRVSNIATLRGRVLMDKDEAAAWVKDCPSLSYFACSPEACRMSALGR
jgi:hypothetical protein